MALSQKQPIYELSTDEDSTESYEAPDLAEYFAQFEMDTRDVIMICRNYANYLAKLSGIKRKRTERRLRLMPPTDCKEIERE